MKKKRYPTYKRKYKRKKQPRRKILTAIILCVILAVCNGWMPPRSLKEVKDQSRIFGQVFLTYIEENAQILWEDVSESASDAVAGLLKQSQTKTGGQTESVSLNQIPEYSGSPYVEINGNEPDFSKSDSPTPCRLQKSRNSPRATRGALPSRRATRISPTGSARRESA